jgi:hypothetical protein
MPLTAIIYCVTAVFTHILPFNDDLTLRKPEVAGSQIWAVGGLTDLGDVMLCKKKACMRAVEWAGTLS